MVKRRSLGIAKPASQPANCISHNSFLYHSYSAYKSFIGILSNGSVIARNVVAAISVDHSDRDWPDRGLTRGQIGEGALT